MNLFAINESLKLVEPSFLFAIWENDVWLGQRMKIPGIGMYGAMGGKADIAKGKGNPQYIERMSGVKEITIADKVAEEEGREYSIDAAIREFGEEAFHERNFSPGDVKHAFRMGFIQEYFPEIPGVRFLCHYHIGLLTRGDFNPKPDEVRSIKPLSKVSLSQILPVSAFALEHLRWYHSFMENDPNYAPFSHINFTELLKYLPRPQPRFSSLLGASHLIWESPRGDEDDRWE